MMQTLAEIFSDKLEAETSVGRKLNFCHNCYLSTVVDKSPDNTACINVSCNAFCRSCYEKAFSLTLILW